MYGGMKVLAVALRKGGVGKTLFSVLLGQYFGQISGRPRRTLLIDLDTQQNASECLLEMDVDPEALDHHKVPAHPDYDPEDPGMADWDGRSSSADIFLGDPSETIIAPYPTSFENLDVLPAAGAALQAVELVRTEEVKQFIHDRLRAFFDDPDVQQNYDLIIIDTPPGKGAINRSVLRAATHVLYPVVPEEKPINGLRGMIQFERMERRHRDTPIEVVGVVPNMVNQQTRLHQENLKKLRSDSLIGPMMADFHIGNRIAFPTIDKPGVNPETIWEFKNYPDAKEEAFALCRFVEARLFGNTDEAPKSVAEGNNDGFAQKAS